MRETTVHRRIRESWARGERLVAPLLGFPGVELVRASIKLAQQNVGIHYRTIKRLYEAFRHDIVFPLMDLSVEANALGRYTLFPTDESATIPKASFSPSEIDELGSIDILLDTRVQGYCETMKHMNLGLPAEVIRGAYVTGPYTVAGLIMGTDEAALATLTDPADLHRLLELATAQVTKYAHALIASGAQLVCILEPSAVMLGPKEFTEFSGDYVREIVQSYRFADVASLYHVCGNSTHLVDRMLAAGVNGLSLDSPEAGVDLPAVAHGLSEDVVLVGNLSPTNTIRTGGPAEVRAEVRRMMQSMAGFPSWVVSTGCDLPQEVPAGNVAAFVQAAREFPTSHAG
jgi:uroporphyrinogen decarboxylase